MRFHGNQQESNKNIDFAIDTPPQCLTILLNSTNCRECDDSFKTKLDEQLKEIRKCRHQNYLNTKPIINTLSANPSKWSKTLKQFVGNLRVFDHFMNLALKGLITSMKVNA